MPGVNSNKLNLLLKLPLGLILCASAFFHVYVGFLAPMLYPDRTHQSVDIASRLVIMAIMTFGVIGTLGYLLWLSFCLVVLVVRYIVRDEFNMSPFIFIDLPIVLITFIPIMWVWFYVASAILLFRQMLKFTFNSAIALEAWILLVIFGILLILMVAIFLRGYMLMLYFSYDGTVQSKAQSLKNMLLCFATSVFTALVIVYL